MHRWWVISTPPHPPHRCMWVPPPEPPTNVLWSFNEQVKCSSDFWYNRPISQIPKYICAISHNAAFCSSNVHMCAHFCCKMVHCGIFVWCIVRFVRWVYWGESLPTTTDTVDPPQPKKAFLYLRNTSVKFQKVWNKTLSLNVLTSIWLYKPVYSLRQKFKNSSKIQILKIP